MNTVLVLRTCNSNMTSYKGTFKWPESGPVSCPDWNPVAECGQGLHGLLWGEGDGSLLDWSEDAKWLVVEVPEEDIVDLSCTGSVKVKFPKGNVVFCGNQYEATQYLAVHSNGAQGRAIIGYTATCGDHGTATAGYKGTATAGYKGTAQAGYYGTAQAGDYGTAQAGDYGTATAGRNGTATAGRNGTATAGYKGTATAGTCGKATCGDHGTATAGYNGTATAGYNGTATAGDEGTATCGDEGTATAGYSGTATAGDHGTAQAGACGKAQAGDYGTAQAGNNGTATAGDSGTLILSWWDAEHSRQRTIVGYVGENGILPNVPYKLNEKGEIVRAETQE